MTTQTLPGHDARCRALAELKVWLPGHPGDPAGEEGGKRKDYDPRFESLRGEHEWTCYGDSEHWCTRWGYIDERHDALPYCLRTDGDALDEAIAACGGEVIWFGKDDAPEGAWLIRIVRLPSTDKVIIEGRGATPREAKSAALYQAIFGPTRTADGSGREAPRTSG